ncbi:MAG: 30S ribosomal protein S1 [Chlamydiae bacterium RIFCSPHIGHO2_12_FULL_44_59]|nr:MAG: 30S ribosomal protein S1 [Chlamydiae bacterium RIFCSPHIGHO2_01_FULL_44_39]OGN59396.1 MAG: 30S ribosomal protein S1 [Chlamydiae bacterium RIFCSPHIGHO2_02_FULL_45_9]OGN59632.1 MAG: 30S ribosomal protein S1 [Chlamydiae bacterium RIFCSPHIGHO2_12_FULL_44_59]OGN65722.1 MAG: 30S ribosomal protein S1 [Chlamydiae bacterium RIFCSPLOWO2_01_FULL_44_52]OGN67864.1 MAG: 30S ribosomal protein S1 [Chlamydiae bacterium RIFCSPLOWO2_02_FULL_45_22]OGN69355.1 MAG: 30S ribosomal protein S1 [Chlamydiae bacter
MSKNPTHDWNSSIVLDDVDFQEHEARQFRDLLYGTSKQEDEASFSPFNVGELLIGRIAEITKDYVVVDVGLKSEGLVPIAEFADSGELILGANTEVFLDAAEGSDGQIVLSKEKARKFRQWEHIVNHCTEGSIVHGKVIRKVKGGLMVDIGMEAFLPGSQIDNKRIKNLDDFVGKSYEFKILKINIERKNIVVSRRELLEEERVSKKAELIEHIEEGTVRKGTVKNITDFGVFLDLDGIDGLLHITDMTWKRIKHPSELVQLGEELEVVILHVDREKGRVALGLKQKEENPWEEIEKRYPPGTRVKGKIVNLVSYGAFIEIEAGIEGLIHVSEMSWTKNITEPSEMVHIGDEVEAIVLSVQKEEGKISLGIKQTERNPWEDVERKYPEGSSVFAEIRNLTNYGAFVELEPGVDGLIHISDLSWIKKVSHPSEVLKKGDKVEAVILSVDKESKKITLGVKQLSMNPWETIEKTLPVGSLVHGSVTKTTAFGAFVQLDNGIEALIHVTEISDQPFAKVEDVIQKGDSVTAKVIKLDPEHKKIALSIKEYLIEKNQENRDDIVVSQKPKKKKKKIEEDEDEENE